MKKETLAALQQSIDKWVLVAKQTDLKQVKLGSGSCPLCELFINNFCVGCPVYKHTRRSSCNNTPYHDVVHFKYLLDEKGFRAAARKELAFLRSLLPAGSEA